MGDFLVRAAIPLLLLLLSSSRPVATVRPSLGAVRRRYDSIFSFGDSCTDIGNNPVACAWYGIPDPASHPPYGSTFFGHPTGRSCDGRLIIDAGGANPPSVNEHIGPIRDARNILEARRRERGHGRPDAGQRYHQRRGRRYDPGEDPMLRHLHHQGPLTRRASFAAGPCSPVRSPSPPVRLSPAPSHGVPPI